MSSFACVRSFKQVSAGVASERKAEGAASLRSSKVETNELGAIHRAPRDVLSEQRRREDEAVVCKWEGASAKEVWAHLMAPESEGGHGIELEDGDDLLNDGIRYLIDDLDCLESCNSIPMASVGGPVVGGAATSADFGLSSGAYTAFDGAAAMGGGSAFPSNLYASASATGLGQSASNPCSRL